jgi:uncharacterized protein (DUF1684 family)
VGGKEQKLAAVRLLEPGVSAGRLGLLHRRDLRQGLVRAGRYLDPQKLPDGRYVLDFNFAYNPNCAISPYYNCPVPPAENRLGAAIRAGAAYRGHADDDHAH